MSRSNPNIPLGVRSQDFASPLIELQAAARKDKLLQQQIANQTKEVDSKVATDTQQRTLTGQTIDTNAQTMKQNVAKQIAMDTIAAGELLKGGQTKEAGSLMINNIERMKKIGIDTTNAERIAMLAATDPVGASQYIEQHVLPVIHATMPEIFSGTPVKPGEVSDMGQSLSRDRNGAITATSIPGFETNPRDTTASGGVDGTPMSWKEWQQYSALPPDQQEKYLTMKRTNQQVNLGDRVVIPSQVNPAGPVQTSLDKGLPPQDAPDVRGQQAAATEQGKLGVDRMFEAGKARSVADTVLAKNQQLIDSIDEIVAHPGLGTATGASGTFDPRSYVPGTDSKNAQALISTLKNKVFLESLQSLKAAGGTLGQVSNVEGDRMENAMAALNTAQGDEQFIKQLGVLKQVARDARGRIEQEYQRVYGGSQAQQPTGKVGRFTIEAE